MGELEDAYFPPAEAQAPEPSEDASEQEWLEWADGDEQAFGDPDPAQEWEPGPGDYPALENLSAEAVEYVDAETWQARQEVGREDYEQGLLDRVAEAGREFGISSPQGLNAVAGWVDEVKRAAFTRYLADGYDVAQAGRAVNELVEPEAIRYGIADVHYRTQTDQDASLKTWRAGREEQARVDAAAGRTTSADVMNSPYIAKLGARLAASAERQAEWSEGVKASYRRQTRGY